ncbi:MAG TPA: selenocysteine-specific translation elongation factor [Clostridia bacterium]|nr:selenocysteine-specific translation elongation factor [Clostridia bacterium]
MSHVIIGTAGHVDHGKSSLILALTNRDPDRLAEEKARGITIELGFTWLDLPDGSRCGVIDVPGHERFVSNMLAGAGGIDLALLVVAADEGVMPQTREHLGILSLLGITKGVIAVTKCDLSDEEFVELVEEDIREHIRGTFLEDAPLIRTSTMTGEGIEELRDVLFDRISDISLDKDHLPFRLPVDRVFTLGGFGTIVTGTLIEGTIRTGDQAQVYPGDKIARVRGIQIHEISEERAEPGQRVALNLTGLRKTDLDRGNTLAEPGSLRPTLLIDTSLTALPDTRFPITNNMRVHLFHGAREILARVVLLDRDVLKAGDCAPAQLRLEEQAYAKYGDHFIIRFYSPLETVGGGMIIDPLPARRRRLRAINLDDFSIMADENKAARLALAISHASSTLAPLQTAYYRAGIAQTEAHPLLDALIDDGSVILLNERVAISRESLELLGQKASQLLEQFHRIRPFENGMRREELRTRLLPRAELQLSDLVIDRLRDRDVLDTHDGLASLRGYQVTLSAREEAAVLTLDSLFLESGFTPPALDEVTLKSEKGVNREQLMSMLINQGTLVRLTPQILMHKQCVEKAWEITRETIEKEGEITLAGFRDRLETTRKFAIALLEYFDKLKRTRLVDESRVFYA